MGWPDRLYVIDAKGHIACKAKPGPFGFKSDELRGAGQVGKLGGWRCILGACDVRLRLTPIGRQLPDYS